VQRYKNSAEPLNPIEGRRGAPRLYKVLAGRGIFVKNNFIFHSIFLLFTPFAQIVAFFAQIVACFSHFYIYICADYTKSYIQAELFSLDLQNCLN
jgi:hypothetical protein